MPTIRFKRLAACGLAIALGATGLPARAARNINAVLESEVVFLDPHFTTANITRTFDYLVYDTLFAMDSKGAIHPQMVRDFATSDDKLTWTFTLRDGLKWHDGKDVTAADCVASLRRWGPRDVLGRMLMGAVDAMRATDAKTFVIQLKAPFPLLLDVLGKPNAVVPFMIPERQEGLGPNKLTEIVGSGPFVFRPDLWRTGDAMVLDRNPAYVPRDEPADFLAGGKVVKIDRLTLKTIPDATTATNALVAGEVDYQQYVPFDLVPRLKRDPNIKLMALGGLDMFQGNYRLNAASPPFNDPAIRRVIWKLVDQKAVLDAIGIPAEYRLDHCPSFWMCGTPLETAAGSEAAHYSLEEARADLKRTAYHGEPVVFMELASTTQSQVPGVVMIDAMRKAGFTVEEQITDWGTLLQRRAKKEGWSMFAVYSNGADMFSPLTHFYASANCSEYPGWSCDERVTPLLPAFARAGTLDERRAIAAKIQEYDYDSTPSVMWGQFMVPAAYRTSITGMIQSSFPIFWSADKAAK